MTSGALFGPSTGVAGSSGGNKHLVEFRAGRMTLKGRMVHPDKRKGLLYVYQGEDSLMHFCWKDRTTGEVEDDLLIFPDDCEFVRVEQCTTGRVYVLKFKSFTRKYFFWMQEPKSDKDEEYCRRINEVLNNPPTAGRGGGSSSSSGGAPDGDLQNLLNNMSQQQLMQLFGGVGQIGGLSSLLGTMGSGSRSSTADSSRGSSVSRSVAAPRTPARGRSAAPATPPTTAPATTPSATTTNTTSTAPSRAGQGVVLSDLQRYFSGLERPGGATGAQEAVDLAGALSSSEVAGAASEPGTVERLAPHLPPAEGEPSDEIRATLLSPQFAQATNQFSSALSSGQLAPVVSQFGLGNDAVSAATTGDVQAFFKALDGQGSGTEAGKEKSSEKVTESKEDKPKEDKSKEDKGKDDKSKPGDDDKMSVE